MNKKVSLDIRNQSKKYQLIGTTTLLIASISIVFALILPKYVSDTLINKFKQNQETIAALTVNNVWPPLKTNNDNPSHSDIEDIISATIDLDHWTHIFIYNQNRTRVFKKINEKTNTKIQLYHPKKTKENYINDDATLYVINVPIEHQNEKLGRMTIVFSLEGIHKDIAKIRQQIILTCMILLTVSIVILIFISNLISKPLKILLATFNKIAEGELAERANITTGDEFGQLANSFNKMVDTLENSYLELAEVNKNMEAKVVERTQQLQQQIDVRTQAEEKLKDANKTVQSIINASPLPIVRLDTEFRVKSASPAIRTIFAFEEYEIIDKIAPFIYELEIFISKLKESSFFTHQTGKFTVRGRRKNGQLLDLQIASVAQYGDNDEHIGYITIIDDITERILTEKAVIESEAKYRGLIEYSIVGIAILKEKHFNFVNRSLLNIWGYPNNEEFLATPFLEMVSPEYRKKIIELYELLDTYSSHQSDMDADAETEIEDALPVLEIKIICYNGKEKFVEMASNVLSFDNDLYLQITFLDITTRKEAEMKQLQLNEELETRVGERTKQLNKTLVELRSEISQRAKLTKEIQFKSEILERTTSLCFVWNEIGDCIYVAPWATTVLGWKVEELLNDGIWGKTKPRFIDGTPLNKEEVTVARIKNKELLSNEYYTVELQTADGNTKYFKFMDSHGLQNTLITAGVEITEQVLAQRELESLSQQLELSLDNERELNELKTRFISMVSHEFRTPLTVIMSCTSIIQQAIEKSRLDIATQYLEKISKSVKTMTDLMEDVLTIGRADTKGVGELMKMDFVDFVKTSLIDIQESYTFTCSAILATNKDVIDFYSDEKVLKHIVHNLVTNALKYTTNGKDVSITIEDSADNIVFRVADQGIGIPEDDLKILFTNFHRAKNVGGIAGTGLGLHIVKKSVDNLLGTITVQSEVNVGTTFTVTLPKDIREKIGQVR